MAVAVVFFVFVAVTLAAASMAVAVAVVLAAATMASLVMFIEGSISMSFFAFFVFLGVMFSSLVVAGSSYVRLGNGIFCSGNVGQGDEASNNDENLHFESF